MAKTSLKVKAARKPKFGVRAYTRCNRCGRPHSVYRKFGLCACACASSPTVANSPGVTKSSW